MPENVTRVALTIAGSDSGGGAGIQGDLKTFFAHGLFGVSVITAVTAQNTKKVDAIEALSPGIVEAQLRSVCNDFPIAAVKTGMLFSAAIIETVASCLEELRLPNLVVDPVMVATSGDSLLQEDARRKLINRVLPLAEITTPNIPEAEFLTGMKIVRPDDMREACRVLHDSCGAKVVLKGGHRFEQAIDVYFDGGSFHEFSAERIHTTGGHGTGCTFSSALAARLAQGFDLPVAIEKAKEYVFTALQTCLPLGSGSSPLNHWASIGDR